MVKLSFISQFDFDYLDVLLVEYHENARGNRKQAAAPPPHHRPRKIEKARKVKAALTAWLAEIPFAERSAALDSGCCGVFLGEA